MKTQKPNVPASPTVRAHAALPIAKRQVHATLTMSEHTYALLQQLAEQERRSFSWTLVDILEKYIGQMESQKEGKKP